METRKCKKCLIVKTLKNFNNNSNCLNGIEYWCKDCWKNYRKNYRSKNLNQLRNYTNKKRALRIKWFQELKSNLKCIDCLQIYEPFCMDYDHVPEKGKKNKEVSRMVLDNTSKEKIIEEIKKCDLVCLLCHNRRTQQRFNDNLGKDRAYPSHVKRNIEIINVFKSKPCAICKKQYENFNMQIDHINPLNKIYNVCQLKSCKVEKLLLELTKCQPLCALCHRRKSIVEQQEGKYSFRRPKLSKKQKLFYDSISNTKECGLCHKIKNIYEFRLNKKTESGIDTYCKKCFNEYRREKRKTNKLKK